MACPPSGGYSLLVQMLWRFWFWRGWLGNESNDITVPVQQNTLTIYNHVHSAVSYAKLRTAHYLRQNYTR